MGKRAVLWGSLVVFAVQRAVNEFERPWIPIQVGRSADVHTANRVLISIRVVLLIVLDIFFGVVHGIRAGFAEICTKQTAPGVIQNTEY